MLLPFLFVWRQAIEIQIKANIRDLATLRREQGETDERLWRKTVDKRLQFKLGHNMAGLIAEHDEHIAALRLEVIPEPVAETLKLLAALDNGGTGFRYAGVLTVPSITLDFRTLSAALDEAYELLTVVIDAATHGEGV
ncbi:hypothetical protein GCM10025867_39790 [Frondihabitans sucicola]|uniref:Uncharacterized protein n=2 Tax=Frondihabitans sucicola TaxID=1268041 RepID=A0ABN6Y6X6_9MICO|nr:hypothetical protein GCM10025867_39790 [Frondihabitans sucicola]